VIETREGMSKIPGERTAGLQPETGPVGACPRLAQSWPPRGDSCELCGGGVP